MFNDIYREFKLQWYGKFISTAENKRMIDVTVVHTVSNMTEQM
jgi:hypothetical protein